MPVTASKPHTVHCAKAPAAAGAFARFGQLCRSPALWLCLAALLAAGYGYAMAVPAVDMDDLAIDYYFAGGEFLRQGRVTVWLLQALTGLLAYQPFWPELFAAVCLALAGLGLAALAEAALGAALPFWQRLLLAGGLLLWPYHAEILMYANQCGIGLGYLLCVLAALLAWRHLLSGWRAGLAGAAGAAVCLALALGLYESFAPVWLTLVFAILLLRAGSLPGDDRLRGSLAAALRGIWPLAVGIALRQGLKVLLCALLGVSGESGSAATGIFWLRRGDLGTALNTMVRQWLQNYVARAFGVPALGLLALACLGLLAWAVARRGRGRGLFAAGLALAQFSLGILQGTGSQLARASQCFAVFVPFVFWLLLRALAAWRPAAGRRLAWALTALLLAVECLALNDCFYFDRQRWQYEQTQLQSIAARLDELDPQRTLPVVFCGSLALPQQLHQAARIPLDHASYAVSHAITRKLGGVKAELFRYENPQTMVVAWAQGAFGSHEQTYRLMEQVGRPCAQPTAAQQLAGETAAAALPAWPAEESVSRQQGYLLVCLGQA